MGIHIKAIRCHNCSEHLNISDNSNLPLYLNSKGWTYIMVQPFRFFCCQSCKNKYLRRKSVQLEIIGSVNR